VSDDDDLAAVRKMLAMAKTKTKIAANSVDNDYPHDATDSGVYRAPYQNNVANRVVQKDQRMLKHWCVQSGTDAAQHVRQCAGTGRCDRWCSQSRLPRAHLHSYLVVDGPRLLRRSNCYPISPFSASFPPWSQRKTITHRRKQCEESKSRQKAISPNEAEWDS
jgi:hypothetical protein